MPQLVDSVAALTGHTQYSLFMIQCDRCYYAHFFHAQTARLHCKGSFILYVYNLV